MSKSVGLAVGLMTVLAGCKGLTDLTERSTLPSGIVDPETFKTPNGAIGMYRQTVAQFQAAFSAHVLQSGIFTDELYTPTASFTIDPVDRRTITEGRSAGDNGGGVYNALQMVRTYGVQAAGALAKYNPTAPPALRGEVYALKGYAELLLADMFCSGVPLSDLEFEGDFTYRGGSATPEIYKHAIALFDTAITLSGDSARILNFARVGKGRALSALSRDSLPAAAHAVADVPTDYKYEFPVTWFALNYFLDTSVVARAELLNEQVSDGEGGVGIPYRSSGDPRTMTDTISVYEGFEAGFMVHYFPVKYGTPVGDYYPGVTSPVVAASGVEARLIEAEASLAGGGSQWLDILNALRTTSATCTVATTPCSAPAGSGGIAGLPLLIDPASDDERLSLLFAERASWLYLTGVRQGDARRLMRVYGRPQNMVYPTGSYQGTSTLYGLDVNFPIPTEERSNPLYTGCFNRGA